MSEDTNRSQPSRPEGSESTLGHNSSPQWQTVNVPAQPLPPPPPYPPNQQGYGQPPRLQQGGYGAPVYGSQPVQPPPGGWTRPPGYGQPNYSQPDYAELAAAAVLASRLRPRRRRHHWFLGAFLLLAFMLFLGIRVSLRLVHMFGNAGSEQIVNLHDQMKEEDYPGIFGSADPVYQQNVGRSRSEEIFRTIHDSLGDPRSYSVRSVNENSEYGEGSTKTLIVSTRFSKGTGIETMRFHLIGGVWKLQQYSCDSQRLNETAHPEQTF